VPSGAYLLSGHDGPYAVERFTCGTAGDAWRWTATREDPATGVPLGRLELELRGAAQRVHAEAGGWLLRGGTAGGTCAWRRGPVERSDAAAGFTGTSPAWAVATRRLLGAAGPARLRLVHLADEVLATRLVDEAWRSAGTELVDGVEVERWEATDLATGERRVVHLTGELVLEAPGVRLLSLQA
jgi:hypothetical protein